MEDYRAKPEVKARMKACLAAPEYKAQRKAYRARPEVKAREKARKKAYEAKPENKAQMKERDWRRRGIVGMTAEHYDRLLANQNGVCAICGKPQNGRHLAVDHDHETGIVRGLLCVHCNRVGLSWIERVGLVRVVEYLGRLTA